MQYYQSSLPLLALNSTAGFWGLIILSCWQQIGYVMIIYIAGLSGIPHSVIEAASIDGASGIKQFFFIKLPMLIQYYRGGYGTVEMGCHFNATAHFHSIFLFFKVHDLIISLHHRGSLLALQSLLCAPDLKVSLYHKVL